MAETLEHMFDVAAKKRLSLFKSDYYRTHLMIVNGILPKDSQMTPDQIKVLAAFMCLEGDIVRHKFGTTGRAIVMKQLNLAPSALSNQLRKLKLKGALTVGDRKSQFNIRPLLIPNPNEQYYFFNLINMGGQNENEQEREENIVQSETEAANTS